MAIRCGCFGTIFQGRINEKKNTFVGKRTDVTDECVKAVAEHLYHLKTHEREDGYIFGNYRLVLLSNDEIVVKKENKPND